MEKNRSSPLSKKNPELYRKGLATKGPTHNHTPQHTIAHQQQLHLLGNTTHSKKRAIVTFRWRQCSLQRCRVSPFSPSRFVVVPVAPQQQECQDAAVVRRCCYCCCFVSTAEDIYRKVYSEPQTRKRRRFFPHSRSPARNNPHVLYIYTASVQCAARPRYAEEKVTPSERAREREIRWGKGERETHSRFTAHATSRGKLSC